MDIYIHICVYYARVLWHSSIFSFKRNWSWLLYMCYVHTREGEKEKSPPPTYFYSLKAASAHDGMAIGRCSKAGFNCNINWDFTNSLIFGYGTFKTLCILNLRKNKFFYFNSDFSPSSVLFFFFFKWRNPSSGAMFFAIATLPIGNESCD